MDAMQAFFQKYGAVPADNSGPKWEQATVNALLVHFRELVAARRAQRLTPVNHKSLAAILSQLNDVATELWKRLGELASECARNNKEWPGRNDCGRILAELAQATDVFQLTAK